MVLAKFDEIDSALDKLYGQDKVALGELFSAACDPVHIYCDEQAPQRLIKAGLLDNNLGVPDAVQSAVCRKFAWVD